MTNTRIKSIDRMRGTACFCMIFFQLLLKFPSLGIFSRLASHDYGVGINLYNHYMLADMFEPIFLFIIGLTYALSFNSRKEKFGTTKAYFHFITRYLSFVGAGYVSRIIKMFKYRDTIPLYYISLVLLVLSAIGFLVTFVTYLIKKDYVKNISFNTALISLSLVGITNIIVNGIFSYYLFAKNTYIVKTWDVLQSIGIAGLIALPLVNSKTVIKIIVCIIMFVGYTYFHNIPGFMEYLDFDTQGGLIGGIGWAVILIAATICADVFYNDRKNSTNHFIYCVIITFIIAAIGTSVFVVNKGSVSPGYILGSLFFGPFFFYIYYLFENKKYKSNFLEVWGYSPLLVYLLQYLFCDILLDLVPNYENANWIVSLLLSFGITAIITLILYKTKNKRFKI